MAEQSPVGSVDKALRVLSLLSTAGPGGLRLATVAAEVGISKPTTHRLLAALRHRHFVSQDPAGAYRLGTAALELGETFFDEENLPALIHPLLVRAKDELGELCQLGALDGHEVVYLDKAEPPRAIRVWSAVGRRIGALTTALGRALIAAQEVDRQGLRSFAPAGQFTAEEIENSWQAIINARLDGYALERGESEPGIGCVAVALIRAGRPIAAISATMPLEHLHGREAELGTALRALLQTGLPAPLAVPAAL